MQRLSFPLSDLEELDSTTRGDIMSNIDQCLKSLQSDASHSRAVQLIALLKKNPPNVTYENPKRADEEYTLSKKKRFLSYIFMYGLELPGCKHNLFGHIQYFSSFFFDIFVGNFTEYNAHIQQLSEKDLKKKLERREGYCQYTLLFAPIRGLRMVDNWNPFLGSEKQEVRKMYSGW